MNYKRLRDSVDRPYYEKAYKPVNTRKGKRKMRLRGSTVEPVWGTLLHYRRMKKVYTIGNESANKQLLLAAATYNLMKFTRFANPKFVAKAINKVAIRLKSNFFDDLRIVYKIRLSVFASHIYKMQKMPVFYE